MREPDIGWTTRRQVTFDIVERFVTFGIEIINRPIVHTDNSGSYLMRSFDDDSGKRRHLHSL